MGNKLTINNYDSQKIRGMRKGEVHGEGRRKRDDGRMENKIRRLDDS